MKQFLKLLVPPIFINLYRKTRNRKFGWMGNYSSWLKAQNDSSGYDANEILNVVRESLLKVKNGEAVCERDSVLFDEIQYSWPLLTGLLYAGSKSSGALNVCDFGGSLGSTYFQNKKFLDKFENVSWSVVEQKHFVDSAKIDFEDDILKFYYTVDDAIKKENPNILVLSSVLQYIEKPYELLDDIIKDNFDFILIDRTPFSKLDETIKLQVVPPSIYEASYPCRFFDEVNFLEYFQNKKFKIIEEFDALDGKSNEYEFKGFIMERCKDV